MAARYLLTCECGSTTAVSTSQAGDRIRCDCGKELEVPTLRKLNDLPREAPTDGKGRSSLGAGSSWGLRQGIFTVGLIVSLLLAGGAGWFMAIEPAPPTPFDLEARSASLDIGIDRLSPLQVWTMWKSDYEPLALFGFKKVESPADAYVKKKIEICQLYRNILGIAAGSVLALSALLYAVLPK